MCQDLPKNKAVQILIDTVAEVTKLQGKELADLVSKKCTEMGDMPPEQRNFSNSMSQMFAEESFFSQNDISNVQPAPDGMSKNESSQRERFTEGEKLLVLQG